MGWAGWVGVAGLLKPPRLKNEQNTKYTYIEMSPKKIIRLKTPLKSREEQKEADSSFSTHVELRQQSTILKVDSLPYSESLQVTLINEINKLYKQIAKLKLKLRQEEDQNEELMRDRKKLKALLDAAQNDHNTFQEMYELEKDNHARLRKFYEQREREWVYILNEHKKVLEEYDARNGTLLSRIEQKHPYVDISDSTLRSLDDFADPAPHPPRTDTRTERDYPESRSREKRRFKKSLDKSGISDSRAKLGAAVREEAYMREMGRLYQQETRFAQQSHMQYELLVREVHSPKNPIMDDMFDRIVRQTYYRYKEQAISVDKIEAMEDMVKLKNAKTSTKERLMKTIRKLNFQLTGEQELKALCEYVEKAVLEKYKVLRGDYAFDLLVDKLKECEKLALGSNSELERLDREKSNVRESELAGKKAHQRKGSLYMDKHSGEGLQSETSLLESSQRNLELLLNSEIKNNSKLKRIAKKISEADSVDRIKFSIASDQNISEILHGDTVGPLEDFYLPLKALKNDEQSTADSTTR